MIRELAALVPVSRSGVIINLVNPGLCKTKLGRHASLSMRVQIAIGNFLAGRSVEMGSRTLLHGVVADKDSHGCYLSACEIKE